MKEIRLLKASEIECRVGQAGTMKNNSAAWCSLLLYKDARCDQRILDETFGMFGWQRKHEFINNNLFCSVSIKDESTGEWVSKQDVGVESNTEKEKGQASDAFKRACFNWGIGRELYTSPKIFITLKDGEWDNNAGKVKLKAKTTFVVSEIGYDENRNINHLVIVDGSGVARYTLGQQMQVQQPASGESDIDEQLNGYALPAIQQARTREELTRIWNDFTQLQGDSRFLSALNNRQNEINAAA